MGLVLCAAKQKQLGPSGKDDLSEVKSHIFCWLERPVTRAGTPFQVFRCGDGARDVFT